MKVTDERTDRYVVIMGQLAVDLALDWTSAAFFVSRDSTVIILSEQEDGRNVGTSSNHRNFTDVFRGL